jgi:histidinol phosphatase-like PHP family hydrolase
VTAPVSAPVSAPAGAWRPRDCHAHTTCSDGALAPAELVAAVEARGALPSVADHLSRDVSSAVKSPAAVAAYLDMLEALRVDVPALGIAGEFCWHDALWRELDEATWARFTHTVGSLHAVTLPDGRWLHMFASRWPAGLDVDAYMDAHVASLERFAAEMPVELLAHPTLLPIPLRERPLEELWTEAREARAVAALARAGIAFEVSNRYRPHARFVARAVAAGVRLSLGSDGHSPEQVGDVAWPLATARAAGAADATLYDPLAHGRRPAAPRAA